MEKSNIWLIDHKATLSEVSPLNMDGSEWMKGIFIVYAENEGSALERFRDQLRKDSMEEIKIYKVCEYREQDCLNHAQVEHITHGVERIKEAGDFYYIGTQSSEGFADSESEADDE